MKMAVLLGATALFAIAAPGCGGGGDTTNTGGSAGANAGGGGAGGVGGGTGGVGGNTNTGGNGGTGGGTGGTGGVVSSDNGVQGSELVAAGGQAKSTNYSMVFSLGQSTQNQGRSKSAKYLMQGGFIGATGSLK